MHNNVNIPISLNCTLKIVKMVNFIYIFTTIKIFEKEVMIYPKRRKINRLTQIWVRSSTLYLAVRVYDKAGSKS